MQRMGIVFGQFMEPYLRKMVGGQCVGQKMVNLYAVEFMMVHLHLRLTLLKSNNASKKQFGLILINRQMIFLTQKKVLMNMLLNTASPA